VTVRPDVSKSRRGHQLIQSLDFQRAIHLSSRIVQQGCRLEIFTIIPDATERIVISSITSINLRTIAFLPRPGGFNSYAPVPRQYYWEPLDNTACGLVDKLCTLGYEHTLELEFVLESTKLYPERVGILNTLSGEVLDLPVSFIS